MLHDDDAGGNVASSANASHSGNAARPSHSAENCTDGTAPAPIPPGAYGTRDCWDSACKQTDRTVCTYQVMLPAAFRVGEEQTHMPLQPERMRSNRIGARKADAERQGMADGVCTCERMAGVHGLLLLERRHAQAGGGARIAAVGTDLRVRIKNIDVRCALRPSGGNDEGCTRRARTAGLLLAGCKCALGAHMNANAQDAAKQMAKHARCRNARSGTQPSKRHTVCNMWHAT